MHERRRMTTGADGWACPLSSLPGVRERSHDHGAPGRRENAGAHHVGRFGPAQREPIDPGATQDLAEAEVLTGDVVVL